jgi:hypothetical protein
MGKENNKRKSDFLGIPHGTATNKLRKLIIFSLVQKTGEDRCFRCGKLIESVDQLSIEHKEPWEGRSIELFWDLNNIAFSHLKCNRPHGYTYNPENGIKQRKAGPVGTAWCSDHKQFLSTTEFSKGSRWDGLRGYCDSCRKARYENGKGR